MPYPFLLLLLASVLPSIAALGRHTAIAPAENPLPAWAEDRYIDCIFYYDDFNRMNIFGCRFKSTPICRGNLCYMRQHKSPAYFLYTSGCVNLTQAQFDAVQHLTNLQMPARSAPNASQLCEVTTAINSCVCASNKCNNVSAQDPFKEYLFPTETIQCSTT
ncbi:hypothetical protein M3Y99_00043000 [Aphelenchoides fujianensis]|nr:hypothetical protein M3Y99_00043000 [Aphelenchoides fujianensis]